MNGSFVVLLRVHTLFSFTNSPNFIQPLMGHQFAALVDTNALSLARYMRATRDSCPLVCGWTFTQFLQTYPKLHARFTALDRSRRESMNLGSWLTPRFTTIAPIALFASGRLNGTCNDVTYHQDTTHIWALESDAVFHGDALNTFFRPLQSVPADLLSTGFAAGVAREWWGYFLHTFPDTTWYRRVSRPGFGCGALNMRCRRKRCSFYDGLNRCPSRSHPKAVLFRQIAVERFSPRLIRASDRAMQEGHGALAEMFESTLCLTLWNHTCVMRDWQDFYPSSYYVWNPAPIPLVDLPEPNMWIHPMKPPYLFYQRNPLKRRSSLLG